MNRHTGRYLCSSQGSFEAFAGYLCADQWIYQRFQAHQVDRHLDHLDTWSFLLGSCIYKTRLRCILSTTYKSSRVLIYQMFFVIEKTDSGFWQANVHIQNEVFVVKISLANASIANVRQKMSRFNSSGRIFYSGRSVLNPMPFNNWFFSRIKILVFL